MMAVSSIGDNIILRRSLGLIGMYPTWATPLGLLGQSDFITHYSKSVRLVSAHVDLEAQSPLPWEQCLECTA